MTIFGFKIIRESEYNKMMGYMARGQNLEQCAHWFHKTPAVRRLIYDFCCYRINHINIEYYRDKIAEEIIDKTVEDHSGK